MQCHITNQLVHSLSVDIRISQPSKVMLTSKECITCVMIKNIFVDVIAFIRYPRKCRKPRTSFVAFYLPVEITYLIHI